MKAQKLIGFAAMSCLLLGVSGGVALAQVASGCGDGVIQGETFDGTLRVSGEGSCAIIGSTIRGSLRVINVDNVLLLNNVVGGRLVVDGQEGVGVANVIANTVFGDRLVVREVATANIVENETVAGGDIRVRNNIGVIVQKNISTGDLICRGNTNSQGFLNVKAGVPPELFQPADCED